MQGINKILLSDPYQMLSSIYLKFGVRLVQVLNVCLFFGLDGRIGVLCDVVTMSLKKC